MLRAAQGDRAAFGLLVERHHRRALNVAYRLTGDVEWAKDATQESFLRLLKAAPRYQPRGAFTSYLFTVLRNVVRETARSRARRREETLESVPESALGRSLPAGRAPATPAEILAAKQRRARLQAALQALPFEVRTVFVLSESEALSYREIATICACPLGTVASRKHAAVLALRQLLGERRES
jgi:RNA polymerase sigma-70 factor (ECF subfamily)